MKTVIAYRLELVANARRGRGGFSASTRAAHERRLGMLAITANEERPPTLPVVVTLTRVGKGSPDWDNVVGAFKHVRDGVADGLGVRDNDRRVEWRYETRKSKTFAIEIAVEARP